MLLVRSEVLGPVVLAPIIIGACLVLLGVVFATIGTVRTRRTRGWVRTRGWICGRNGEPAGLPDTYPTFTWLGPDGSVHRRTSSVRGGLYRKGTEVEVMVDPHDPRRGQLAGPLQGGMFFAVIGWILQALGAVVLLAALLLHMVLA